MFVASVVMTKAWEMLCRMNECKSYKSFVKLNENDFRTNEDCIGSSSYVLPEPTFFEKIFDYIRGIFSW